MRNKRTSAHNIYESFSDIALLMLATFMFLLVTIIITSRVQEAYEMPRLKKELAEAQADLKASEANRKRLLRDLGDLAGMNTDVQIDHVLETVGLNQGQGRKDFDLFVKGLKDLPGKNLHLVVDATGSMHGAVDFLIPVLRVIVLRSGKDLDALTWFSDRRAETYRGTMGEMFDGLLKGAPFMGSSETIGEAFLRAEQNAPAPSAYLLIGDEASDDRISYHSIPSPVFTLPIGKKDPATSWEYKTLADKTGGRMLQLEFH